jgi:hypothetical protein
MTLKTTILAIVGSLTLAIPHTYQSTFAETPGKLSQAQPSLKASAIPNSVVLQVRQNMAKRLNLNLMHPKVFPPILSRKPSKLHPYKLVNLRVTFGYIGLNC